MKALDEYREMITECDQFIRKLDESIRVEVFRFLIDKEQKSTASPGVEHSKITIKEGRGLSPQELIRKCQVTNLTDKALVLAYWLEDHEGKTSFSSGDLKDAFVKAREPAPANPSDVVARLDGAGKVMKAEKIGKGQQYRLTVTGIKDVTQWYGRAEQGAGEK